MAGYGHTAAYHRSPTSKAFIAAKIARLAALDFMRVPPDEWTPEQRRAFVEWLPDPLDLAEEVIADARFPHTLRRLGIV